MPVGPVLFLKKDKGLIFVCAEGLCLAFTSHNEYIELLEG